MKINKVFKYKFVPNKTQIELLDNHFFSFNHKKAPIQGAFKLKAVSSKAMPLSGK